MNQRFAHPVARRDPRPESIDPMLARPPGSSLAKAPRPRGPAPLPGWPPAAVPVEVQISQPPRERGSARSRASGLMMSGCWTEAPVEGALSSFVNMKRPLFRDVRVKGPSPQATTARGLRVEQEYEMAVTSEHVTEVRRRARGGRGPRAVDARAVGARGPRA